MNWLPACTVWFAVYPATKILFVPSAEATTELVPKLEFKLGFCANTCPATEFTYFEPTTMSVAALFALLSSTTSGCLSVWRYTGTVACVTEGVAVRLLSPVTLQLVEVKVHVALTLLTVKFAYPGTACPTPTGPTDEDVTELDVADDVLTGPTVNCRNRQRACIHNRDKRVSKP